MKKLLRVILLSFAIAGLSSVLLTSSANAEEPIDPAVATTTGDYYLTVVCRSNDAGDRFDNTREKAEKRGWSYGDKPTKAMRKAARKASRAAARAARQIVRYTWPESVASDAQSVAETLYENSAVYGGIAKGGGTWFFPSSNSAASRLRLTLGLGPNNTGHDGCSK